MYGLMRLLTRFGSWFLFLFLEAVCIYMIVRYNENQGQIYASSASVISGSIMQGYHRVTGFIGLKKQIAIMQQRISELENQNTRALYDNSATIDTLLISADSTRMIPMFTFSPAEIINNSITGKNNMLTINRGRAHGINPPMAVIADNGIIGIVRHSTKHFSSVMSVLNAQSRISASVRNKGFFGSLIWRGRDPRYLYLVDVPKHNIVQKGDTIETSGFSYLFPRGIPIGIVEKYWTEAGEGNQQIKVRLIADLSTVRRVYVVKNLFREEFEELEQQAANE